MSYLETGGLFTGFGIAIAAIGLSVISTAPAFASPSSPRPAMNVPLKHHTVTFPDCRLHFDYPADLKPSPDFVMQKMATEVDYQTIRWVVPTASEAFVSIHTDLKGRFWEGVLATVGVEMWLCATAKTATGDISKPAELKWAFEALGSSESEARKNQPSREISINDRIWVYLGSSNIYMTALNGHVILVVRVGVTGNTSKPERWREWAARTNDSIISSLRIDPKNS